MNKLHGRLAILLGGLALLACLFALTDYSRAWLGAAALALAFEGLRLTRTLHHRAAELLRVAGRLAGGDFGARVRDFASDQPGRLGMMLNLVADRFESAYSQLSRDRAQSATILSHIVEAVVAVNADGRVLAVNAALCALFSVEERACAGRSFVEVLRHARLNELLASALKEGRARVEEVDLLGPEERFFEAHALPIFESGRLSEALLVLHDITRIRRLERMRRDFVANVSHELRTPLASIRAFAETLRDGAIDDKAHRLEFIEAIEKDAESLTALVDDLLDLSAIESGQRQPALAPIAPLEVARQAAASLKPLATRRGVEIVIMDAPRLPVVRADSRQLKQVLSNLIDNGVKFNKAGGKVTVAARAEAGAFIIQVSDTGSGIPEADLPRIFERFYRVEKARSRELGGTGLGLSIVRHIVEAHKGTVTAQSRVGEGSTFTISLPL